MRTAGWIATAAWSVMTLMAAEASAQAPVLVPPMPVAGVAAPVPLGFAPYPFVVGVGVPMAGVGYYSPIPPTVVTVEPAFLHTQVMPMDPVWPYAYFGYGAYGATSFRERVRYNDDGFAYRTRAYGPGGNVVYRGRVNVYPDGYSARVRYR